MPCSLRSSHPDVTQEETLDDFADSGVDDLVGSLYQMDLDRTLFLLRSYLRLRLKKVRRIKTPHLCLLVCRNKPISLTKLFHRWEQIEKYTMHISRSDDLLSRLSQQEQRFAKRYCT